ncbi:GlxA family transcriptional regulator [Pseudomonas donghuensis]|uniref:GlxA family transcriptional regulator n=1 Tax=Pseudomonas donghuensis TaxID=1163398 RepID=UPI0020C4A1B0|nr:helix-turn-helix domain-containing protein [Pseudomonas donghuensis]MCP6696076.1 helix-turn-helix domain-containing protein [Pseudomonas donghuensis]UVL31677.1 helix-turn-helix domain-containing protein [Pseudomonas donghuensis]
MYDFTVLVFPGAFASSVAATLDILGTAATLAQRRGLAVPRWRVCGPQPGLITLGQGMLLQVDALTTDVEDNSCWVIPGLGISDFDALLQRLEDDWVLQTLPALKAHVNQSKEIAASCSAVFLLHAAGLLTGRRVTTSWWLAPWLSSIAPDCIVDPNVMVLCDPPLTTAGAAFAQTDLMLHLLRRRLSPELADVVGKALLLDGRQLQSPFINPAIMAQGNTLVANLTAYIEARLPHPPSVPSLAAYVGMSERTLSRHIQKATGLSTRNLIQRVQLNRARVLLETSRYSVEFIAEQVGYQDATALRRLMRRLLNASPKQLRQ